MVSRNKFKAVFKLKKIGQENLGRNQKTAGSRNRPESYVELILHVIFYFSFCILFIIILKIETRKIRLKKLNRK